MVYTLFDTNNNITTYSKDKKIEHAHIKTVLNTCGYPDWMVRRYITRKTKTNTFSDKPKSNGLAVIPYARGVSERITKILEKRHIS